MGLPTQLIPVIVRLNPSPAGSVKFEVALGRLARVFPVFPEAFMKFQEIQC
jgi:hypothetical protein